MFDELDASRLDVLFMQSIENSLPSGSGRSQQQQPGSSNRLQHSGPERESRSVTLQKLLRQPNVTSVCRDQREELGTGVSVSGS